MSAWDTFDSNWFCIREWTNLSLSSAVLWVATLPCRASKAMDRRLFLSRCSTRLRTNIWRLDSCHVWLHVPNAAAIEIFEILHNYDKVLSSAATTDCCQVQWRQSIIKHRYDGVLSSIMVTKCCQAQLVHHGEYLSTTVSSSLKIALGQDQAALLNIHMNKYWVCIHWTHTYVAARCWPIVTLPGW